VFMDTDGNVLSEQFTEETNNNIMNNTNIRNMAIDNQQPNKMEAIEDQADQQPQVTEDIENESTNDNDT